MDNLQDAITFAEDILREIGRSHITVKFNNRLIKTAGRVFFNRHTYRVLDSGERCYYKRMEFNTKFFELNPESECLETILHEIGHVIAGINSGHDWRWEQAVRSIGGNPTRYIPKTAVAVPAKYKAVCPVCGFVHYKARRSRYMHGQCSCNICCKTGFNQKARLFFKEVSA